MRIGLTGPIGAGKSVVAAVWREQGAGVVDGDEMGRQALEQSIALRTSLAGHFGREVLNPDGSINRSVLGRIAFSTAAGQQELTRLTFPVLYGLAQDEMTRLKSDHQIVIFDAALIFEWGIEKDFDRIVVITAPLSELISRSAARLRISHDEARERLSRQLPPDQKAKLADMVIWNDGSEEELKRKALEVWQKLSAPI